MLMSWARKALRSGGEAEKEVRVDRPASRSALFLHQSYYHFRYLAEALRRRGWDALAVTLERPDGPNAKFYHGEDLSLFDPDPAAFRAQVREFVADVPRRFRMVHFAGDGMMAVDPANEDSNPRRDAVPWEFLEWKRAGVKIGYTAGGCADGIAQSSFYRWSDRSCDKCPLMGRGETCSDLRNLAWGHKREMFCDLIAGETLPALDYQNGPKVFREPLTMGLDPVLWNPQVHVPVRHLQPRRPGEVLVYHAVGNYTDPHYGRQRDYKGTQAVRRAVDRLAAEGLPIRLLFVHDLPSTEVRFLQVQADIVVDQLNFGRYGANARECMMLGRTVVGHIRRDEPPGQDTLACLEECPIVEATEETIEAVLRRLTTAPEARREIGEHSRSYALKWHSADALAARYEAVYDWVIQGGAPAQAPCVVDDVSIAAR